MRKVISVILIFIAICSKAQPVRLQLLGGFSNYSGDIQQRRVTLNQANSVVSAGATFNITGKFALRGDASLTRLGADDKKSPKAALVARNLNFKTNIEEVTLTGEYDFFDLDEHRFSPYVFAGIGFFHFSPYTTDSLNRKVYLKSLSTEGEGFPEYPDKKVYSTKQFNIPYGAGVKYALSRDLYVGFEMGFRKLFTDYIDDVSTTYIDKDVLLSRRGPQAVSLAFRGDELKSSPQPYPAAGTQRGNSKNKDYYYYGQLRISFRMPWFDNEANQNSKTNRRGLGCPAWKLK